MVVSPSTYGPIGSVFARRARRPGRSDVDQTSHLQLVEHRRRRAAVLGDDPQAERVERADAWPEVGRARLHLQLGLLVVGDGEHGRWLVAAVEVQVAEPLGEHPGLAGPGGGDHAGRAADVADGSELVGCERRRSERPVRERGVRVPASTESLCTRAWATPGGAGARGPPSTQAGVPSGRRMSAGPSGVAAAPSARRAALTPHHQIGSPDACVVGVGPGQEVQAVEPWLGLRSQPPRLDGERLRFAEPGGIDCQLDDDRLPRRPRGVHPVDRRAGRGEDGFVDPHDRRVHATAPGRGDPAATTTPRPRGAGPGTGTCSSYAWGVTRHRGGR